MSTIGNLKSVIRDIKYIEAEIERRQSERIQPYLMILSDDDLKAAADDTERGRELEVLVNEYLAAGKSASELRKFLYPQQEEAALLSFLPSPPPPPAPIATPTEAEAAWRNFHPQAETPAPPQPPQPQPGTPAPGGNGVVNVRFVGHLADGSFNLPCADGKLAQVYHDAVYQITEQTYTNLFNVYPKNWWIKE